MERRSVITRYHGSNISGSQQWGAEPTMTVTATRTAKKQLVYISKATTLHVYHAFLYISLPSLQVCDKLPKFMHPLYRVGEHSTKIFFFYTVLWDSTCDNFANILQIK